MASQAEGECCVCGTSTAQRCGACSEAGFDLFFCSREHQKLVYFAHKQVCGERSKPFSFPPFAPDEVATLKASCMPTLFDGPFRARIDNLVNSHGRGRKAEDLLSYSLGLLSDSASTPATSGINNPAAPLCTCRRAMWTELAKAAGQQQAEEDKPDYSTRLKLSFPTLSVSSFACCLADLYKQERSNQFFFPVGEDWYIRLMHHAFVFSALFYRISSDVAAGKPYPSDLDAFLRKAAQPLRDILCEVDERDKKLGRALEGAFEVLTEGSDLKIVLRRRS